MSRGPSTFKQRDLTAAIKAAKAAGATVARVEIENGKLVVIMGQPGEIQAGGAPDLKGEIDQWQP
jgi:hypothetical protein